jgi:hypothetical protein
MKNSIKISTLLLAFTALTLSVKAQSNSSSSASTGVIFSAGVESGISSGNFNNAYRWNVGGSLQADIPVANKFYATVNAGYLNFNGKNNVEGTAFSAPNIRLLPVMAGLKYFPINNFYIQGDAGAGFALNKSDVGFTKTAAFLYAPQVGVQFSVGGQNYIDAGIRYEATTKFISNVDDSKINFFELRVAYAFGIK